MKAITNDAFRVGFGFRGGVRAGAFLAGLLLPLLTAGCDIFGPSSSEEIILEPFEATWLSEPDPIDPATHPPESAPSGEVMIDSLFYRAELLLADTAVGAGPMALVPQVRLRNPFDEAVTIKVPGCHGGLRVYETIARMDPPIWHAAPIFLGLDCVAESFDVTVPPHAEITGEGFVRPFAVSQNLPDGRYYFTMELRREGEDPLVFPVGSADVRFREPGLEFGVTVEDTGERVRAEVWLTNRNDVPMLLEWGGCSLPGFELYRKPVRSSLATRLGGFCVDYGVRGTVGPGETIRPDEFIRGFDHARVLELPPGTYFLSLPLSINWHEYHIPAGAIRLR